MRYLRTIVFVVAGLFCLLVFAGPSARAAPSPSPSPSATPAQLAAATAQLTQQPEGQWTTTVFIDTGALCPVPVSFVLLTATPYSRTTDTSPRYDTGTPRCGDLATYPVTEVTLAFTPGLAAIPQSATLALTPSAQALAAGVLPMDIALTVRRDLPVTQYVWIPFGCGLVLVALFVGLTMLIGMPRPGGDTAHKGTHFWRIPLYAGSAWTFGDSWATNITAIATVIGTVLAASGSISELLPGVELGKFSLLIALAGGITAVAPMVFGALNYQFSRTDAATADVVAISLPPGEANLHGVRVTVPASASVTVFGPVALPDGSTLNPGASLEVPAGATVTVSATDPKPGLPAQVVALPGTNDIAVSDGQQISFSTLVTVAAGNITPAVATAEAAGTPDKTWLAQVLDRLAPTAAGGNGSAGAGAAKAAASLKIDPGTALVLPEGGKLSFLGRATVSLPVGASISALAEPGMPAATSELTKTDSRQFAIPHTGDVVATRMRTMLAASCLTVFGIGTEIGIVGWVLGFDLAVAPEWARVMSLLLAAASGLLVLGYGVTAIRALADSREGTALSSARGSSFML